MFFEVNVSVEYFTYQPQPHFSLILLADVRDFVPQVQQVWWLRCDCSTIERQDHCIYTILCRDFVRTLRSVNIPQCRDQIIQSCQLLVTLIRVTRQQFVVEFRQCVVRSVSSFCDSLDLSRRVDFPASFSQNDRWNTTFRSILLLAESVKQW